MWVKSLAWHLSGRDRDHRTENRWWPWTAPCCGRSGTVSGYPDPAVDTLGMAVVGIDDDRVDDFPQLFHDYSRNRAQRGSLWVPAWAGPADGNRGRSGPSFVAGKMASAKRCNIRDALRTGGVQTGHQGVSAVSKPRLAMERRRVQQAVSRPCLEAHARLYRRIQ